MIRLPTSEEEAAHISSTFPEDNDIDETSPEHRFQDDDDDLPPPVPPKNSKAIKVARNEADFFDVSDEEDDESAQLKPAGQD